MNNPDNPDRPLRRGSSVNVALIVDARGLCCPMPLLKAKQALNKLSAGESVKVLATDRGSVRDFHAFAEISGQNIISFRESNSEFEYVFQKSE